MSMRCFPYSTRSSPNRLLISERHVRTSSTMALSLVWSCSFMFPPPSSIRGPRNQARPPSGPSLAPGKGRGEPGPRAAVPPAGELRAARPRVDTRNCTPRPVETIEWTPNNGQSRRQDAIVDAGTSRELFGSTRIDSRRNPSDLHRRFLLVPSPHAAAPAAPPTRYRPGASRGNAGDRGASVPPEICDSGRPPTRIAGPAGMLYPP